MKMSKLGNIRLHLNCIAYSCCSVVTLPWLTEAAGPSHHWAQFLQVEHILSHFFHASITHLNTWKFSNTTNQAFKCHLISCSKKAEEIKSLIFPRRWLVSSYHSFEVATLLWWVLEYLKPNFRSKHAKQIPADHKHLH